MLSQDSAQRQMQNPAHLPHYLFQTALSCGVGLLETKLQVSIVSYNLLLLLQITLIIYSCVTHLSSTNRQASDFLDICYFKITKNPAPIKCGKS